MKDARSRAKDVLQRAGYGKMEESHEEKHKTEKHRAKKQEGRVAKVEGGAAKKRLDRKPRAAGGGSGFNPGGEKGKLHREIGVKAGEKIPVAKLTKAAHSKNPEIRRDAIRAETMKKWKHGS